MVIVCDLTTPGDVLLVLEGLLVDRLSDRVKVVVDKFWVND
jgi:hypothetical protein